MKTSILAAAAIAGAMLGMTAGFVAPAQAARDEPEKVARDVVEFDGTFEPGTVVIKTSERRLYYVLGSGKAIRYPVAVGSPQNQWFGETHVVRKRENPSWTPTPDQRSKKPSLPAYVAPGPKNPLGVRAIYLGWSAYRIHGTNAPGSIGRAVSGGCFRMLNSDVVDLFERVHVGAPVRVMR